MQVWSVEKWSRGWIVSEPSGQELSGSAVPDRRPLGGCEAGQREDYNMLRDAMTAYNVGQDLADVAVDYLAANAPYQPYMDGVITVNQ